VLAAGCGTGRTGAGLHVCGHEVAGVDADPVLLAAALHFLRSVIRSKQAPAQIAPDRGLLDGNYAFLVSVAAALHSGVEWWRVA